MVLILAGSRVSALSLKTLKKEAVDSNEQAGALCFAVDELSDRLAIGSKRRVLVMKRVAQALQAARFELLHMLDLEDSSAQDICLVVENGQRWLCIASWDSTFWMNMEQRALGNKMSRPPLPQVDFLQSGRQGDEVVLCRSSTCTFVTPYVERGSISFADDLWQLVLCNPFVIGCLKSGKIQVALDDGQILQEFENVPVSFRWTVVTKERGNLLLFSGGQDDKKRNLFQVQRPLKDKVLSLLNQEKFFVAMSLARSLNPDEPSNLWPMSKEDGEVDDPRLYDKCKFELACSLLLKKPHCEEDDILQASQLLTCFPSHNTTNDYIFRLYYLFADTDIFTTTTEATEELMQLFPHERNNTPTKARFRGALLGLAIREILLPTSLRLRNHNEEDVEEEGDRENGASVGKRIDGLMLRLYVLAKPGKNLKLPRFEESKRNFLLENNCTVHESERLLLSFPEMWQDHAMLLVGKGEYEKALIYLRTLGENASSDDEAEKYALATKDLFLQLDEKQQSLILEYNEWIVSRLPHIGVQVLVHHKVLDFSRAAEYFEGANFGCFLLS